MFFLLDWKKLIGLSFKVLEWLWSYLKTFPKGCQFRVPYCMFFACCEVSLLGGLQWAITSVLMTHSCMCYLMLAMNQMFTHNLRIWNIALLKLGCGWAKIC